MASNCTYALAPGSVIDLPVRERRSLRELCEAEIEADDARRAIGAIPEVFRRPGAAREAYARWEQAHAALQAALREPEAGL